jgi:hypothetical protein
LKSVSGTPSLWQYSNSKLKGHNNIIHQPHQLGYGRNIYPNMQLRKGAFIHH